MSLFVSTFGGAESPVNKEEAACESELYILSNDINCQLIRSPTQEDFTSCSEQVSLCSDTYTFFESALHAHRAEKSKIITHLISNCLCSCCC